MATFDGNTNDCRPVVPDSWRCRLGWHSWTPWRISQTSGFNLAWQLVPATMFSRSCKRCHEVDSYTRVNYE